MKEKVLVTGFRGYIGSEIYKAINKRKYKVYGIDKEELDITKRKKVFEYFKKYKIDYVIHTAALKQGQIKDLISVNYWGAVNLINAAEEYSCKGFIFSSTFESFFGSDYGHSKHLAELAFFFLGGNLKTITLRYAGVFGGKRKSGAIYNFIQNAKKNLDIRVVEGETRFIHIKDVVKANLFFLENFKKMKKRAKIFNLASGLISLEDLAVMIRDMLESKSNIIKDPIYVKDIKKPPIKITPLKKAIKEMIQ